MNRRYWKLYAQRVLRGKWGMAILGMMAAPILNSVGVMIANRLFPGTSFFAWILGEIFLFIVSLLSMIVSTGYNCMLLNMARGTEYRIGDLISMFKKGSDGILIAGFIISLIDTVLMLPFYYLVNMTSPAADTVDAILKWGQPVMISMVAAVVLGMLIKLPFSLTFYLLADDPKIKGTKALKKSTSLMKGRMFQYLLLQLSFVPMIFLSVFTFYIALLWVMPYMYASNTVFYMDAIGELRRQNESQEMISCNSDENHRTGDDYDSEA